MLARLSKTLSTNVAIAGLTALVLGAGGTTATLAAGHSPTPSTHASDSAQQDAGDQENDANDPNDDANEAPDTTDTSGDSSSDQGTRPTDTHGYCVSQLAQSASTERTGTGANAVSHGSLVSAAAQACGKTTAADKAARAAARAAAGKNAKTHGKGFGKQHGTGRPAVVTPGH